MTSFRRRKQPQHQQLVAVATDARRLGNADNEPLEKRRPISMATR